MIDFVSIECDSDVVQHWKDDPLLDFTQLLSVSHGDLKGNIQTAGHQKLKFLTTHDKPKVKGSLPHYLYGSNDTRFTFEDLNKSIDHLKNTHHVNPETAVIHSLEIEINMFLKYSPQCVIESVISHKGRPFVPYKSKDFKIGKQAIYDDHIVKIYDKGRQTKQKGKNILRFGVRVTRMRFLEGFGIRFLSDLQDPVKVANLSNILLKTASELIFHDYHADISTLTDKDKLKWKDYALPMYWDGISGNKMRTAKATHDRLRNKINAVDYKSHLLQWIDYEVRQMFEAETLQKKHTFTHRQKKNEAEEKTHNYTYKCNVETCEDDQSEHVINHHKKIDKSKTDVKRYCVTCGRDITNQKRNSIYCSERLHGKKAKQCRNIQSNKARTEREKQNKQKEFKTLQDLKINNKDYTLTITVKTETGTIKNIMIPKSGTDWAKINKRKLISVRIHNGKHKPTLLHSLRGRAYIEHLRDRQDTNPNNR